MMKRAVGVIVLCMLLVSFSVYAINFDAEATYNSVVVVYSRSGVGSGFFVKENMIITNAHVVENDSNVDVELYDGTTIRGVVVKTDEKKDLALISVGQTFVPLTLNSEEVKIGQEVYAIGAPKDMPYTMTKGIVSALERELGQNEYIQIDASVNSGNSGGPLVDDDGKVIGIITLKASNAEGIGFAIEVEDINNFINGVVAEIPEEGSDDTTSGETPQRDNTEKELRRLSRENLLLKVAVCFLIVTNIVIVLLWLMPLFKKRPQKKEDEFDFEIEIEE